MKKSLLLSLLILFCSKIYSACLPGFSEIVVQINPDNFYYETSWNITDLQGNILAQADSSVGDTLCVPSGTCNMFNILDSYGDGILSPGGYFVYVDGVLIASGHNFGFSAQHTVNCPSGTFCTNAVILNFGQHTAQYDNTWYFFTPAVSGTFLINTCGLNTCNTKIWVYTTCPTTPYSEGVQGTYAFNDDAACGTQASLHVVMMSGVNYYIRIGDNNDSCSSTVDFEFSYVGPIQGCTDPLACNYNPMAVVDDSSCIYPPNPLCSGPDLQIDSAIFMQSLGMTTTAAGTCDVAEGCVTGYGTRYVLSFTSRINNIGTQDFYIGNSSTQPGMFNLNNCHGHAHYEGYGDYRLFDSNGKLVPAGHKNGYCVIDLCGAGQYVCGNMGISAGCYDAYGAGTQCQWIDITDVPTGDYRVAVIINSKHLPDALGRYETNYINNATQVCMHITNNSPNAPTYTILSNCTPYVDCAGVPGGNSEPDCNGICNGPGVFGDVFQSNTLDSQDVYTYMDMLQSQMPAATCNDLNSDSSLSIYDAALINWCRRSGPLHPAGSIHNHCNFPRNIVNPNEVVSLAISNANFNSNYIDVQILNTASNVAAYQFTVSGIEISSVYSLANPVNFPVDVRFIPGTNEVVAISLEDSTLIRSNVAQPLVRIYFSAVTDTQICITKITDIVNQAAERVITTIYGNCFASTITSIPSLFKDAEIVFIPNPASDKAFVHLSDAAGSISELTIMDISGKTYSVPKQVVKESWYELDLSNLPGGVYILSVRNNTSIGVTRFVKL